MCGICGFYNLSGSLSAGYPHAKILTDMNRTLRHRGPDGEGIWLDPETGIALGQCRLAVRDLSPAGAQPMFSHSGRYVLIYNGELYNVKELKNETESARREKIAWRGTSDTEVFLEALAVLGVKRALELSNGMFAFALWDKNERSLILGRDRFGVKPLYWCIVKNTLLFGSEMKAIIKYPDFHIDVDRDMLCAFFRRGYLPPPLSLYKGVRQLKPGHTLTTAINAVPEEEEWWSARKVALAGVANRVKCHKDSLEELHALLRDAVRRRLVSDVPVGAFLSGGIDSSLITALMQEASSRPIRTFSIGFENADYNEAPYAKAIARELGTCHDELYVTARDAWELIPRLSHIYDGPFADSSQIPTYFLSALARREVTVALTGDGGDELFGGYPQALSIIHPQKFLSRSTIYQCFSFSWQKGEDIVIGGKTPSLFFVHGIGDYMLPDTGEMTQLIDTEHYLSGDILTKVDRASMAVSLETRVPFLDHRVYALAWRMPPELRRAMGKGKWPLRHLLDGYVPPRLTERPKQGFSCPVWLWLHGPLREWAETLLSPRRLAMEGWLDPKAVRHIWRETLAGRKRIEGVWTILMFQAWLDSIQDNK